MFPHPISRSEFRPNESHPDLTRLLEENLLAGFPLDLALDLVFNELVVRAAEATRAAAAALALARGDEMVCRAATGHLAPDLGIPLNIRDGLSGACLQTRQPQLSVDTEFDPRGDPAISPRPRSLFNLSRRLLQLRPETARRFRRGVRPHSPSRDRTQSAEARHRGRFAQTHPTRSQRARTHITRVRRTQPTARSPFFLRSLDACPRVFSHS